jgi:hypothetical protein
MRQQQGAGGEAGEAYEITSFQSGKEIKGKRAVLTGKMAIFSQKRHVRPASVAAGSPSFLGISRQGLAK